MNAENVRRVIAAARLVPVGPVVPTTIAGMIVTQVVQIWVMLAQAMMETETAPMQNNNFSKDDTTTWALPKGAIARLGRGTVMDIAFSPDSEFLAVATKIGVWHYELTSMKPIALWETERGMVSTISFSPNGQQIITGDADGVVKIWDMQKRQLLLKIEEKTWHNRIIRSVLSPDGQYLAVSRANSFTVSVWCAKTGMAIADFNIEAPAPYSGTYRPVCFSPDSQLLAYMSGENTISVIHLETGASCLHFTIDSGRVNHLVFSPCGQFLVAGVPKRAASRVHVWNVQEGTPEATLFEYGGYLVIPIYSPGGTLQVADVHEDKVIIWDAHRQEKLGTFEHRGTHTQAARFSADGQQFAIAGGRDFQVWQAGTPQVISPPTHLYPANSVRFFQNDKTLLSGYTGGSGIVFWDVAEKVVQHTLPTNAKSYYLRGNISLSPDEKFLATSWLKTIEIWDITFGTRLSKITENQQISAVAFSPTGKHFVSATEAGELYVWDTQQWEKQDAFKGQHTGWIQSLVFRPDGKQLVSLSREDKTVRIWDFETRDFIALLPLVPSLDADVYKGDVNENEHALRAASKRRTSGDTGPIRDIAFSPCGTRIVGGLTYEIRFWDATTYKTEMVLLLPHRCRQPFTLAFSPCGRYLASGSWWAWTQKVSIRLWEVSTGENIATLWGHSTDVQSLAFSPDGSLLASGGYDGTILLWDMESVIDS